MFKYIFTTALYLLTVSLYAHQVDISSTVLAQQKDDSWILQIKAPLTALQYEVKNKFGDDSYASPEEFQELVLQHLQEQIAISFDQNAAIKIEGVTVKIGHETSAVFKVFGIPEDFNTMNFTNSSFKNISRNRSALLILKKGFSQKQFILNNKNSHTVNLKVDDSELFEINATSNSVNASTNIYMILLALGITGIMILIKLRSRSKKIAQ